MLSNLFFTELIPENLLFKELGEKDQCGRTYENFFF
jgi:hypothetical protein